VTFVELFFDLVFVFSVTQVVRLLHHGLDWITVGQALLVFWLVWWAWTQFTWTLNAANAAHPLIQLAVLVATALAFIMAVALPEAFQDRSVWFGVTYVLVRALGLALQAWVASEDPTQRSAVRTFTLVSLGGLAAVLAGAVFGGTVQIWLWGAAILLDVLAAAVGGQLEGWNLHAEHFGERHGLFVIIALGETLIVAASVVTDALGSGQALLVAILAVAITCSLWWSYFPRLKPVLDHAVASRSGPDQTKLARDVFSLFHFPMLCGVVAYAVTIELAVAHPGDPLSLTGRIAMAAGLGLFAGGMAFSVWRATRHVLGVRVFALLLTMSAIVLVSGFAAVVTLALALAGLLVFLLIEQGQALPAHQGEG
jgi:low temperature requirement protein LtrA